MAPEKTSKKRKSAPTTSPSTKKIKKTEAPAVEEAAPAKPATTKKAAAPKADTAAKSKSSRKRASDFFEGEEEPEATEKPETKSDKASKKSNKKQRKVEPEPEPESESEEVAAEEEEDAAEESENEKEGEDDQTAALLKGFESSEDEQDGEDEGFDADKVPAIPNEKKLRKKLSKAQGEEGKEGPGVVYVGRVPHGFYEHQMRAYFSQFGDITRVRLSRNKKTGRSKHYAFIEFAHASVARIVAETMDKYLMFGHILQVRYIPADQVHPDLFKGANRRFKPAPRNKMEGRHLRLGMERGAWENRIKKEEQRRKQKEEKLKALGYDFEAPAVKGVDAVGKKTAALPAAEEAPKALTEKPHQETEVVKEVKPEPSKGTVTEKTTRRSKRISAGAVEEKVEEVQETKPAEKKTKGKKEAKESKPKAKKAKASK
ncbi:hypothetical protein IWZ01DRAFT_515431 [Phyllosticta capitalensis]